ncbi:MAG: hypothetical protein IID38_00450 [Planctomycetes bacterium]|nr:hypothetical protein [Planctomycetota bacterium]
MKRRETLCSALVCVMAWAAPEAAVAQRIPPDVSTKSPMIQRRMAQIKQLHDSMTKTLKLGEKQGEAIDRIFAEHEREVMTLNPLAPRRLAPGEVPTPGILKATREMAMVTQRPTALMEQLEAELNEDQSKAFAKLVDRWEVLHVRHIGEGSLRLLQRAVRDPALEITTEKRKALVDLLSKARTRVGPGRPDQTLMQKVTRETRDEIAKQLTPAQKAHFIETVTMLQQSRANEAKKHNWLRDRDRGRVKP